MWDELADGIKQIIIASEYKINKKKQHILN